MKNFKPEEFSEDIKHADPKLLINLDNLRDIIGAEVYPSPAKGALARFDFGSESSQHYAVDRLSTAIDFFCNSDPFEAWVKIIKSNLFTRVGIYFDTYFNNRKWVMFHVDLKDQSLMWTRNDKKYCYSSNNGFYNNLFKLFFLNRENMK